MSIKLLPCLLIVTTAKHNLILVKQYQPSSQGNFPKHYRQYLATDGENALVLLCNFDINRICSKRIFNLRHKLLYRVHMIPFPVKQSVCIAFKI